jgi:hypothetical protein
MPCRGVDEVRQHQTEIGFTLLPRQVEKCLQFFDVGRRTDKPIFVSHRAEIEVARIPKEIDQVDEPAIFPDCGIETVSCVERASNLRGVAQAQHNFWCQLELVENLMPHRHQARHPRVLEAKIPVTHSRF